MNLLDRIRHTRRAPRAAAPPWVGAEPLEFTFNVEAEGLSDPRLDDLDDLHAALEREPALLGPAIAANIETGTIDLLVTVQGLSRRHAARLASEAFGRALVATARTASVARVGAPTEEAVG